MGPGARLRGARLRGARTGGLPGDRTTGYPAVCYTVTVAEAQRNERQDMLMFFAFVVLCASVILTVLIARHSWSTDTWTAIGAIGAFIQGAGVIAALVYAGR